MKQSGKLVQHLKTGKRGRTYNSNGLINKKIPVYFEDNKEFEFSNKAVLCQPENLKLIGFID